MSARQTYEKMQSIPSIENSTLSKIDSSLWTTLFYTRILLISGNKQGATRCLGFTFAEGTINNLPNENPRVCRFQRIKVKFYWKTIKILLAIKVKLLSRSCANCISGQHGCPVSKCSYFPVFILFRHRQHMVVVCTTHSTYHQLNWSAQKSKTSGLIQAVRKKQLDCTWLAREYLRSCSGYGPGRSVKRRGKSKKNYLIEGKVARRPWAPRIVLEFAIKTRLVLDSWKTPCCPWIFSGVLENSWILLKLFI